MKNLSFKQTAVVPSYGLSNRKSKTPHIIPEIEVCTPAELTGMMLCSLLRGFNVAMCDQLCQ